MTTVPKLTDALLTLENRVATLTLNRHDLRNALTCLLYTSPSPRD